MKDLRLGILAGRSVCLGPAARGQIELGRATDGRPGGIGFREKFGASNDRVSIWGLFQKEEVGTAKASQWIAARGTREWMRMG